MNLSMTKVAAIGTTCALVGAGAGVLLNASASPSPSVQGAHRGHGGHLRGGGLPGGPMHGGRGFGGGRMLSRIVHGDLVVAGPGGTFGNVTVDQGFVTSVVGDQLTIDEGVKGATYKTAVTLTIPATAKVIDNRKPSTLPAVQTGQHVAVIQAPKGTFVLARDAR